MFAIFAIYKIYILRFIFTALRSDNSVVSYNAANKAVSKEDNRHVHYLKGQNASQSANKMCVVHGVVLISVALQWYSRFRSYTHNINTKYSQFKCI